MRIRSFNFVRYLTQFVAFGFAFLLSGAVYAAIDIQTWKTDKGTKVLFVESHELPMLDIEVTFDAGSARDGENFGLANMTSALIGTATQQRTEDEVAKGFDELGAQVGGAVNRDSASVSLRTLTRPEIMDKSILRFTEVLTQPKFDEAIFNREMKRLKIGLKQRSVEPQAISSDLLWTTLYQNHAYGHNPSGNLESIKSINLERINQFYNDYYVANNAVIAIVGNVNRKQAEQIAEQLTAGLKKGDKPVPLSQPESVKQKEIIQEFDSTQTYYYLTQLGVKRGEPDYIPLFVGNHLFGGSGFGSKLMEEVREKRGLVYSVYSYFAPLKTNGPFVIGLSTKNSSAKEADAVVRQTFTNFLNGFADEKLQAIKENLVGGFPLRIDSNGKILGYISMIGFYNLPLNYLDWFPKEVEKVTKEQILAAWKKHVDSEQMITVMVGKPQLD